jgi:hypothetical protein
VKHWKPTPPPQRELPIGADVPRRYILGSALIVWLIFWTIVAALGGLD